MTCQMTEFSFVGAKRFVIFCWRELLALIRNVFGLNTVSLFPLLSVRSWFLKSLQKDGAFVVTAKAVLVYNNIIL